MNTDAVCLTPTGTSTTMLCTLRGTGYELLKRWNESSWAGWLNHLDESTYDIAHKLPLVACGIIFTRMGIGFFLQAVQQKKKDQKEAKRLRLLSQAPVTSYFERHRLKMQTRIVEAVIASLESDGQFVTSLLKRIVVPIQHRLPAPSASSDSSTVLPPYIAQPPANDEISARKTRIQRNLSKRHQHIQQQKIRLAQATQEKEAVQDPQTLCEVKSLMLKWRKEGHKCDEFRAYAMLPTKVNGATIYFLVAMDTKLFEDNPVLKKDKRLGTEIKRALIGNRGDRDYCASVYYSPEVNRKATKSPGLEILKRDGRKYCILHIPKKDFRLVSAKPLFDDLCTVFDTEKDGRVVCFDVRLIHDKGFNREIHKNY